MTFPAPQQRKPTLGALLVALGLLVAAGPSILSIARTATGFVGTKQAVTRAPRVAAGAGDPAMRDRIASVKKTGKLTDAMRLVAAAKVRRAQDQVTKARPFSEELQGMIQGITKKAKMVGLDASLPMLRAAEVKAISLVVLASDRGLCGGYNTFVFKQTIKRLEELKEAGVKVSLVTVGKRAISKFNNDELKKEFGYTIAKEIKFGNFPGASLANEIGEEVRSSFISGESQKVEIIYSKFINLLKNEPSVRTLLPLSPSKIDAPDDVSFEMTTEDGNIKIKREEEGEKKKVQGKEIVNDMIFDQPPESILNSMLPLYLNSQILQCIYESLASELGSRMTAMKAATDNADELAKKLLTLYNKQRQSQITQELLEVVNGALSLEGGEQEPQIEENTDELLNDFFDGEAPPAAAAPAAPAEKVAEPAA